MPVHIPRPLQVVAAVLAATVHGSPILTSDASIDLRDPSDITSDTSVDLHYSKLTKRDVVIRMDSINCGTFATADNVDTYGSWNDNLMHMTEDVTVPGGGSCVRVATRGFAAQYVCNDNAATISVSALAIGAAVWDVGNVCSYGWGQLMTHQSISGQIFINDPIMGRFNVVVGFGDVNDPDTTLPSTYNLGGKWAPTISCGTPSTGNCSIGTCSTDTAVVETTRASVNCLNGFLAQTYTGAGGTLSHAASKAITVGFIAGGGVALNINFNAGIFQGSVSPSASAQYIGQWGTTTQIGSAGTCGTGPGNWTCGLMVQPICWEYIGYCMTDKHLYVPYDAFVPKVDTTGGIATQDNPPFAVTYETVCVCKNCPDWADWSAPRPLCPIDCDTCNPLTDYS